MAQVVGAALEQRGLEADAQRIAHARQVAVVELVLQRAGAGGDDGLHARQDRRHQVGEGLAGAGAGLGQQRAAAVERIGDRGGQVLLGRTRRERGDVAREVATVLQRRAAGLAQATSGHDGLSTGSVR